MFYLVSTETTLLIIEKIVRLEAEQIMIQEEIEELKKEIEKLQD